jgi:hypothetical protein
MKIEHKQIKEEIDVEDTSGKKHRVIIFTPLIEIPPANRGLNRGRSLYPRQNLRMELGDKRPINRIDDDTFQIVVTGEILNRVR